MVFADKEIAMWLALCCMVIVPTFLAWQVSWYIPFRRMRRFLQDFPTFDKGLLGRLYAAYRTVTWKPTKGSSKEGPVVIADIVEYIEALRQMHYKHGYFFVWVIHTPFVIISKAEFVEKFLLGDVRKSPIYDTFQPYFGNGLVTSNGTLWKKHGELLTPAFQFRMLEDFIPLMNSQARTLVEVLSERSRSSPWLDIYPIIGRCALDIICESSMGIDLGSQRGNHQEYWQALNEIQSIAISKALNPMNQVDFMDFIYHRTAEGKLGLKHLNTLLSFTKQVFNNRKKEIQVMNVGHECRLCQTNDDKRGNIYNERVIPLIDILLHFHLHEKELSEQEVQDQINTFMATGYESTALAMTWTLYLLGLHPEIQKKVQDELTSIFGSDKERGANKDDIGMMKYLECVIKESLRLRAVIPLAARYMDEDIPIDEGMVIPRGAQCIISIHSIHQDKKVFHRPERFLPDRFLPEQTEERHPYSYIPFIVGPRACIGQNYAMNEIKIVLSSVLRCFSVKSLDPQDKISVDKNFSHKPKCPIRITFTPL